MLIPDASSILGARIQHNWREKGNQSKWKGTVLDRVGVNPSLFMVKYDGFDCVYGIELFKDDRVSNLQVLSEKVGEFILTPLSLSGSRFSIFQTCVYSFQCCFLRSKQQDQDSFWSRRAGGQSCGASVWKGGWREEWVERHGSLQSTNHDQLVLYHLWKGPGFIYVSVVGWLRWRRPPDSAWSRCVCFLTYQI